MVKKIGEMSAKYFPSGALIAELTRVTSRAGADHPPLTS